MKEMFSGGGWFIKFSHSCDLLVVLYKIFPARIVKTSWDRCWAAAASSSSPQAANQPVIELIVAW